MSVTIRSLKPLSKRAILRARMQKLARHSLQLLFVGLFLISYQQKARAQYCTASASCSFDYISNVQTTGGSTNISNNTGGCGGTSGYNNFTVTKIHTGMQGTQVNFAITTDGDVEATSIWVDFNGDTLFTGAGENVYNGAPVQPGATVTGSFIIPANAVVGTTRMRVRCNYNSSNPPPCGPTTWGEIEDYGFVITASTPCAGTPTINSVTPSAPLTLCAGTSQTISVNVQSAGGLNYQWQSSPNCSTWTPIAGATNMNYTFTATATMCYRCVVTCTNSSQSATSSTIQINVAPPAYATIPYVQDFESWQNYCGSLDVPSNNWSNQPVTGNNSWRRHDQGSSAGWSGTAGLYAPVAASGSYSARFHTWDASSGTQGALNLYLNCSTVPGNKELQFQYINTSGSDVLAVLMSVDSGATFTSIGSYTVAGNWTQVALPIVSNSPKTIIRFRATSDYGVTDIGLDNVRVVPPCSGKPSAGTVASGMPCQNTNFTLSLINSSVAAGLTYQWQESTTGLPGSWSNMAGGTQPTATSNISAPKYFRCIVTCTGSGQADTTLSYLANLAPFYYCYCNNSTATSTADDDIGNVTISSYPANTTLLNNGVASPLTSNPTSVNMYTDFRSIIPPVLMFRDSIYKLSVTQINSGSFYTCGVAAYIDFNRNGVFDTDERILTRVTSSTSNPANQVSDTFRVRDTAQLGITGMRVILVEGNPTINPCGSYTWGETEDYLVNINFPPCDGPSNAGVVVSSDTAMCAGYPLLLTDTTYEKYRSGLSRVWEQSSDFGGTWSSIPGGANRDTITVPFTGTTWYRLKMTCTITSDITYSNIVKINLKPAYKCYCYSMATGGNKDTSDIGAFSIGNFVVTTGGPHLINPVAIRGRNDYTDLGPIELYVDSTYPVNIFHTMPSTVHGDGLITLFMDFNNNLQYDIPEERIILSDSISNINGWYKMNNITIPGAAVLNAPTGMRVILNNNVGYNTPSYTACGPYTSGETEDYVVVFRKGWPLGVGNIANLKDLNIYPNPTTGRFALSFTADKLVKDLKVQVTTVTGQTIMQEAYNNIGSSFNKEFNLSEHARGIYFVEITADGEKMVRKLVIN